MLKSEKPKQYDLEDRMLRFAKNVRNFVKQLPTTMTNREDVRQIVRSSGSIAGSKGINDDFWINYEKVGVNYFIMEFGF